MATINWNGKSGNSYEYTIYNRTTAFKPVAGNYVFAKESRPGHWTPIYFGETGDLSSRFLDHHQNDCIDKHGATHIHVHSNSAGRQARLDEETDLRAQWSTPCNKQ